MNDLTLYPITGELSLVLDNKRQRVSTMRFGVMRGDIVNSVGQVVATPVKRGDVAFGVRPWNTIPQGVPDAHRMVTMRDYCAYQYGDGTIVVVPLFQQGQGVYQPKQYSKEKWLTILMSGSRNIFSSNYYESNGRLDDHLAQAKDLVFLDLNKALAWNKHEEEMFLFHREKAGRYTLRICVVDREVTTFPEMEVTGFVPPNLIWGVEFRTLAIHVQEKENSRVSWVQVGHGADAVYVETNFSADKIFRVVDYHQLPPGVREAMRQSVFNR